jgi:hypothetical protein
MTESGWLQKIAPAFRLLIGTSWLAPDEQWPGQQKSIAASLAAGVDWQEYLRLVDRHRTPALSWAALNRVSGITIPPEVEQGLQKRSDACRMDAVRQTLLMASVLRCLNAAHIPVMPFKGVLLSDELYGDPGLRHSRDLDLAVPPGDLDRARTSLESLGWHLDPHSWFPKVSRQWESYLRHEHHLDFVHPHTGCALELHWRNQWETSQQTEMRWEHSIATTWQGCTIQAMSSSDLIYYLCSHGAEHAWCRIKWLGDLARGYSAGLWNWELALHEAGKTGQARVIQLALGLLAHLYGFPLPQVAGANSGELPAFAVDVALENMGNYGEPTASNTAESRRNRLRMKRYERLLRPELTWSNSISDLWYCREDFKTLSLPDGLFWAYMPLRPFLWAWRKVTNTGYKN